jgi:hypothetical protein
MNDISIICAHTPDHQHDPCSPAAYLSAYLPTYLAACSFNKEVPERIKELIQACWEDEFEERPEFIEIVVELEDILTTMPPETPITGPKPPPAAARAGRKSAAAAKLGGNTPAAANGTAGPPPAKASEGGGCCVIM